MERLETSPLATRLYGREGQPQELRRLLLPRSRYFVYFDVEGVSVLAVWHASRPVANPAENVWLYEVEHLTAIVSFCSTEKGVKLLVSLIAMPDDDVSETFALRVLRRFRGVGEFVAVPCGGEPVVRTYFGELTGGAYAGVKWGAGKVLN